MYCGGAGLDSLIGVLDPLEDAAKKIGGPARFAVKAAIDVIDQAFQMASMLAFGKDADSPDVRVAFLFAVGKLSQVRSIFELPDEGPEARYLEILNGNWED
ncbi:hypothetical protein [Agrobacterium sp. NPDC090273]|uniref:hypothetical protein n=1 Tax=Agrobacterium sp. NPDC090273 TaxID=3363919 RepID=UPI00383A69B6